MKKISVFIGVHLWIIILFVSVSAQDFQIVRDGIEYARVTRQSKSADGKDENVVINLLRLDLTKVRLDVVHAMDAAIGLEKTSSIATRHGAFAAINAGFFRIDKSIFEGDDVGALKIDRKVLSESIANRIALFINNNLKQTDVNISHLNLHKEISINKKKFDLTGINRERKENDLVVFTPEYHRTTLTDASGLEIVVQNGKITQILDGKGSTTIPANGFVVSASGEMREQILEIAKLKAKVKQAIYPVNPIESNLVWVSPSTDISTYFSAEDIVSGVPQLIEDGKVDITWQEEKTSKSFVETHHPRTAVAKLKDGKFLMVTIDGRSEESGGMSLYQLADFLIEQGAIDAINLDGGGSSTMFLDGKIVNHPSDKEGERKVGDVILVFPRKKN